jgi:hypothetical protein
MATTAPTLGQAPQSSAPRRVLEPDGETLWAQVVRRKWLWGSVAIHGALALVFAIWKLAPGELPAKKFMKPGGGAEAAQQGSEHTAALGKKQSVMSAPEQARRVTTTSSLAQIALPDMPMLMAQSTEIFPNREAGTGGTGDQFGPTGTSRSGGAGDGKGISFFQLRSHARSVVFLVDLSSSMVMSYNPPSVPGRPAPAKIVKDAQSYAALEREVTTVIQQLDPGVTFNVICFAGEVLPYRQGLGAATQEEKQKAMRFVQERSPALGFAAERKVAERQAAGFKPAEGGAAKDGVIFNHGGTQTSAALKAALAMNPDLICLASDGVPTDKSAAKILAEVAAQQKSLPRPVVINVIAYLADSGQDFMKVLAEQNQGTFKEIKPGR